jgi:hypothetical protein
MLAEVPNSGAISILQEGTEKNSAWATAAAGADGGGTVRVCSNFKFASAGQRTVKLLYEKIAAATAAFIYADRNSSLGGRDVTFTVRPFTQQFPAPVFTEVKNKINIGQSDIKKGLILVNFPGGVPTINKQFPGSWVSSLTDNGTGLTTVNFSGGYFSSVPICLVSLDSTTGSHIVKLNGVTSSTSTQVRSYDLAGTNTDLTFALECTGN